jgi:hypothetical protein
MGFKPMTVMAADQTDWSEHFLSRTFREKRALGERGFDGPFSGQKSFPNRHTVYRVWPAKDARPINDEGAAGVVTKYDRLRLHSLHPKSSSSLVTLRPFLNKVNGGRFSIHQQEAAPFEIFHYVIAPSRSKLALVLRHQTMQAVQFFADFLPQGVLGVTTWHLVNPLIVQTAARLGELFLDDEG